MLDTDHQGGPRMDATSRQKNETAADALTPGHGPDQWPDHAPSVWADDCLTALDETALMISQFAPDGTLMNGNAAARRSMRNLANLSERFIVEDDFLTMTGVLERGQTARGLTRVRTADGIRWHDMVVRRSESDPARFTVTEHDVTVLKESEQRIAFLANHDSLTGLPNRTQLEARIPHRLRLAAENGQSVCFFLLDIDAFKGINDALGKAAGDDLLVITADRLTSLVGDDGFVARYGADEFLICHENCPDEPDAIFFADIVGDCLRAEVNLFGTPVSTTPSIGISRFPQDGTTLDTLIRNADLALQAARNRGKAETVRYAPTLRTTMENALRLEQELREALAGGAFEMFYQPRVNCVTHSIVGAEALVRWNHPTRGRLTPGAFIDVCEQSGLIDDLGRWIIETVGRQQVQLAEEGHENT
ncbi:MAG: diguanylate cyclase, partial [Pseudomonadota bacterium]